MALKKNVAQLDAIDALLPGEQTVTVGGTEITLTPPTEAAVRKLRRAQYAAVPRDGVEPDTGALADASLDMSVAALEACIGGLDRRRAFRLVLASGGEAGELVRTAMGLCGINLPEAEVVDDDLPT